MTKTEGTLMAEPTPSAENWEDRFRARFPGEELPYPYRDHVVQFHLSEIRSAERAATLAERERCAKIADAYAVKERGDPDHYSSAIQFYSEVIAFEIRTVRRDTDPFKDEEPA